MRRESTHDERDFQDEERLTPDQQIDRLMNLDGLRRDRVDKAAFAKAAVVDTSWVDPWALMRHHVRITTRDSASSC